MRDDPRFRGVYEMICLNSYREVQDFLATNPFPARLQGFCVGTWRERHDNIHFINYMLSVQDPRYEEPLIRIRLLMAEANADDYED